MPKLFDYTDGRKGEQVGHVGKIHMMGPRHGLTEHGLTIRTFISRDNLNPQRGKVDPTDFGVERVIFAQFDGYDEDGDPTFEWSVLSTPEAITEEEKERSRHIYAKAQREGRHSYQPGEGNYA